MVFTVWEISAFRRLRIRAPAVDIIYTGWANKAVIPYQTVQYVQYVHFVHYVCTVRIMYMHADGREKEQ